MKKQQAFEENAADKSAWSSRTEGPEVQEEEALRRNSISSRTEQNQREYIHTYIHTYRYKRFEWMYVGRSGPRGLLTGPRSLRIDFTRAILFDYFRKGARGGAPACLSALAFRGHGGGPSTGGLCPHKWLPGSAVAHLPLIPTPGLTFASSFLCSCFPLPLDTPWPPLFLSSSAPPSPNLSLSLSLFILLSTYFPVFFFHLDFTLFLSFLLFLLVLTVYDPLSSTAAHVCTTGPFYEGTLIYF